MTKLNKSNLVLLLFLIFSLLFFYTRGVIPSDEGWILNPALRVVNGEIPYKDFHYIYTPGVIFVMATAFKMLGESIFVSRIVTMLFALSSVYAIYRLTNTITNKKLLVFVPVLMYLFWGPFHTNFAWPAIFAIFSGLFSVFFITKAANNKSRSSIYYAGMFTAFTFLFKQNFGAAVFISSVFSFFIFKNIRAYSFYIRYFVGIISVMSLLFLYLILTGSLIPFLNDFYFYMFEQYFLKGLQSTPFIYPDCLPTQVLKTPFYLIPLLVSLPAFYLAYIKKRNSHLVLSSFCLIFYVSGIRPTTDYNHLTPLLSLTGFPLVTIFALSKNKITRIFTYLLTFILLFLGIYTSLFKSYYRWESPLIGHNHLLNSNKTHIFVNDKYRELVPEMQEYISTSSASSDYIFVYNYVPLVYFLTDKKNPTRFEFLPANILSQNDSVEIIKDIEAKHVRLIVSLVDIKNDNTMIGKYIRNNFDQTKTIQDYTIWER